MKKNKIIIISLVAVLVLACITFAILFFATDIFKGKSSNKEKFNEYISQIDIKKLVDLETLNSNMKRKKEEAYSTNGNLSINVNANGEEYINEEFEYTTKVDPKNERESCEFNIKIDGETELTIDYLRNEDLYGILLKDIVDKYIALENNNLNQFVSNIMGDSSGITVNVPSKIEIPEEYSEIINIEEIYQILSKYINIMLKEIPEENYSKIEKGNITVVDKTVDASGYSLKIDAQALNIMINKFLETLKTDEQVLNLINEITGKGYSSEEYQQKIDELSESITIEELEDIVNVIVFSNEKGIVKLEVVYGENLEIGIDKTENEISAIVNAISANGQILNFVANKNAEGKYKINCNITADGEEITIKVAYDSNTTFNPDIKVEEFNESNYLLINDLSNEQIQNLFTNILKLLIEKTNIENGIIGTTVSEIMTSNLNLTMNSQQMSNQASKQAMEIFNAKLSGFEGEQRGTIVKQLLTIVEATNSTNSEHTISCEYDIEDIDSRGTYDISFEKDSEGYINEVIVEEK